MVRRIPHVADGVLHAQGPPGASEIAVDSPAWAAWLEDRAARSFSFEGPSGTFTARKERRSGSNEGYWSAYRKRGGKLRKVYLGKAENLTLARLDAAAARLTGHGDETTASPPLDAIAGDGGSRRAAATEGPAVTAGDRVRERPRRGTGGDPLLLTKLSVPSLRRSLVPRRRLSERLDEGLERKLTLLSAPAGFGKTTLLSSWIGELSGDGRPVAWLSVDPADNDPALFWRYFVTAMDRLQPGSGATALALLGSPQSQPIEAVLTTVLNELGNMPAEAVLVLDDYHLIESRAIHEALDFLIDHLAPRVHLVIATRADPPLPLARLRARDALNEVRAGELRFSREETAAFLNEVMGLELSAEDVAELEGRTEGWIAGLQMAALAMRDRADIPNFIDAFAGSNRHVVDYLAEEVLGRQPEALRTFLLETSILDRMCAPLCNAVSGRTDRQTTLERLEHANLFVIPLDDERRWYRYHHLFADVLRQRLRQRHPALLPVLHQRASGWFEGKGLASEAIHHALAAADWERATRLLVHFLPPVAFSGQFHTALSWLDALPDTLVSSNPSLCVYHAGVLMFTNQVEAAEIRLRDVEGSIQDGLCEDQVRIIRGQVAAIRAAIARIYGDIALCVDLGRQALDLLPEPEVVPLKLRTAAGLSAARAYLVSGDVTGASESAVASVVAPLRAAGNRYGALLSMTNLARLHVLQGRLRQAGSAYQEAMEMVSESGEMQGLVGGPTYYFGMGDLYREWNDLGAAQSHLEQGMELVKGSLTVDAETVLVGYLGMARLQQALGDPNGALATLEEFAQLARQRNFFAPLLARAAAEEARVRLAQGDLMAAARWAEASGLRADDELNYPREGEYLTLARVLVARGRDEPQGPYCDHALALIDRLLQHAQSGARMGSVIELLVQRALVLQARHEFREAIAALERALVLAEPEGYVRLFVDEKAPMEALLRELLEARSKGSSAARQHAMLDYVRRLMAAFESPRKSNEPPVGRASESARLLPDPLTTREKEVLTLIAEGLPNREIATRLFIATSTVKGYVHSVFRKLEVDSRTKAVARAHELHLVSESE